MKITEIPSDAVLRGPIWAETLDFLVDTIFATNWDVYTLCISIGMMYDEQIDSNNMVPDGYTDEPRYVPRTKMSHTLNMALLEFMLQSAIITTKHLSMSEDERLDIAFSEEKELNINPIIFLTRYANYGITLIHNIIKDTSDVETLEKLADFLNNIYEYGPEISTTDIEIDENEVNY